LFQRAGAVLSFDGARQAAAALIAVASPVRFTAPSAAEMLAS
jgi:hypothetical protein